MKKISLLLIPSMIIGFQNCSPIEAISTDFDSSEFFTTKETGDDDIINDNGGGNGGGGNLGGNNGGGGNSGGGNSGGNTIPVAAQLNAFQAPLSYNGVPLSNNPFHAVLQKGEIASLKVDFNERSWVHIENLAYQFLIFTKARDPSTSLARQDAIRQAILTYGHNSWQYRAAQETPFSLRSYASDRHVVSVSRSMGDMNGNVHPECIVDSRFLLSDDVNSQAPVARNCNRILRNQDGSENKVWFINVKHNNCSYTEEVRKIEYANRLCITPASASLPADACREMRNVIMQPATTVNPASCSTKFEFVRDELYYNRSVFSI
jgi:hypothetical protein